MPKPWHPVEQQEWERDCVHWHGEVLQGEFAHYCDDWDDLPVDETCPEFCSCSCEFPDWDKARAQSHREALAKEQDRLNEAEPFR